ncbi:hypothetical protein [Thermoflavimicrobium dichotomicum]|uniref:Uncharacterized protein n=1 Tax=Thermoflavimicrobium dichotomicum TaxID=46223 RepID=A0A1I3TNM1_9BACL|nr:hypothetical protein [Thermoflavimicrobium dichotomicum]SFJ72828.1 hypothetical protein SAMN05421852_11910 [Thermoflavimicrobium dichotomicum]
MKKTSSRSFRWGWLLIFGALLLVWISPKARKNAGRWGQKGKRCVQDLIHRLWKRKTDIDSFDGWMDENMEESVVHLYDDRSKNSLVFTDTD